MTRQVTLPMQARRVPGPVEYNPVYDPATIAGLNFWGVAHSLGLADGVAISSWTDLSGLGNHAVQATGANQPLLKTGILGVMDIVRFDGVNDVLVTPSMASRTVFQVMRYRTSGNFPDYKALWDTSGDSYNRMLWSAGSTNLFGSAHGYNNTWRNNIKTNSGAPIDSWAIYATVFAENRTEAWNIGREGSQNTRAWDGDCAEILHYSTVLTDTQREYVQTYLSRKYGISI